MIRNAPKASRLGTDALLIVTGGSGVDIMTGHNAMSDGVLLSARSITKDYDGVRALDGASLELRAGEVHALVGENGAGKSTLVKIITGAASSDGGELVLQGERVSLHSPHRSKLLGIFAVYQQPALFPDLTVAENVLLGMGQSSGFRKIDWVRRRQRAEELLRRVGAEIPPEANAGDLTMPQQQLVEIAKAVGSGARVLIMDEPTASLSAKETATLFGVIKDLRARGAGILYITHKLEELPQIADRVTVLRDGRTIRTHDASRVDTQALIRQMVGRELSAVFPERRGMPGGTLLEVRGLRCAASGIHDVAFSLRRGEILGLAGLVGSGRTGLAETLFGLFRADEGTVMLRGMEISVRSPSQAIELGIAYVPEDRNRHGVIPEMTLAANTTLAALARISRFGFLDRGEELRVAADYVRRFRIKTPSLHSAVSALSGGNQQKVALSRWLAANPAVLILDEPTQGIDVGAKAEIHALMADLAARGMAILMISSELPEILGMSDRIAVMRGGRVVGMLDRSEATPAGILALALGRASVGGDQRPAPA